MKAFKFRIYPNKEQQTLLNRTFGCVRWVWNHFLAEREAAYDSKLRMPSTITMQKELTALKTEFPWLKEVDSTALQRTVRHLDEAYTRFFNLQKVGPKYTDKKLKWLAKHSEHKLNRFDLNGHPQWKRKRDSQRSYTAVFSHNNIDINYTHIKLPKLGYVRYRDNHHSIEGKILSATISQEASGKYYVSICCDNVQSYIVPKTGKMTGIDLGLKEFLITSDGLKVQNYRFLRKRLQRIKRLQRALSRKTRGGKRWEKNRRQLAIQYEKVRHARLDFHHKISTQLIRDYDIICVETLKVKNMIKNHKLAQAISDVAWGQFVSLLTYKALWASKTLIKIDTYFPSSQTCSICGYQNKETKNLSVREWFCPNCGAQHDRDINAAQNILAEGLRMLNS